LRDFGVTWRGSPAGKAPRLISPKCDMVAGVAPDSAAPMDTNYSAAAR
jgi:hypothetical protein